MNGNYKPASQEELDFLRHHMPWGMISMIVHRTKQPRWKVVYELTKVSVNQDPEIIQACREILYIVTGLSFDDQKTKLNN